MAVRIRSTGEVLCAAMHPALAGDTYVHDGVHELLGACRSDSLRLLVTEPMDLPPGVGLGGHSRHGRWWWRDDVPAEAVLGVEP